jgi:hypothetical protein
MKTEFDDLFEKRDDDEDNVSNNEGDPLVSLK